MGPSVVALTQPGPWTVGLLFNHLWSTSGATDRDDVNSTFLQPFVNYNMGRGLAVGAVLEATANWERRRRGPRRCSSPSARSRSSASNR